MTPFTVFDTDGRILRSGVCQDESYEFQANEGEGIIREQLNDHKHYIDTVTLDVKDIPDQPTKDHVFDYSIKAWVDPRTIKQFQDLKWTEIKKKRDAVEFGKFEYNGMVFDGDEDAQRRLANYISVSKSTISSGKSFSAMFILADNTVVTLTAQDFVAIEMAKVLQVADAFSKAALLRQSIYAATTQEELNAINWS